MVASAPRYDSRILDAIRSLDDRSVPIAEVNRRVGAEAERLGLPRPCYVHVKRLVKEHRSAQDAEEARRAALRAIAAEVATDLMLGKVVDAYEVADRVNRVRGA